MTLHRLTLLREMRPQTSLDAVWTADEQAVVRERILADRTSPAPAGPSRHERAALAGIVALGLVAAPGVAAALDSGMRVQSFFDAYDYWNDHPDGAVDPTTATRAATAPGPFDGTFSVLTSTNSEGLTCLAPIFESSSSAAAELPDDFGDGGSFCHTAPSSRSFGVDTVMYTNTAAVWWAHAGDAVTAELRMPDGETFPVVRVEGYLFGWYPLPPRDPADAPTLTGYAADGSEVGRIDVAAAHDLLPTVADLVSGASGVVLDLSDVTFFDSAGCRLVDRLARECGRVSASFRVVAPPGSTSRQVLRIVGMVDGLACDSLEEATELVRG